MFISRDQRAIIASAYPFLRQLPYFNQYFETWGFENLDEFARHDAEGFGSHFCTNMGHIIWLILQWCCSRKMSKVIDKL